MLISSVALWTACLLIYISSPNQKLIQKPLIKKVSYPFFIIFVAFSWFVSSQTYHAAIAALIVLIQIMVMWTSTVFIVGHLKPRLTSYLLGGSAFFSLLSTLGGTT